MNSNLTKEEKSKRIWDIEVSIANLKAEQDALKAEVQGELLKSGVYESYKDKYWSVFHKMGAVTTKLDETKFAKDEPEKYEELLKKYTKTSVSKESWSWAKQQKIVEKQTV